jgi:hypothetical protein
VRSRHQGARATDRRIGGQRQMTQILKQKLPLESVRREKDRTEIIEKMVRSITSRCEGIPVIILDVSFPKTADHLELPFMEVEMLGDWTQDYPLARGVAHVIQKQIEERFS